MEDHPKEGAGKGVGPGDAFGGRSESFLGFVLERANDAVIVTGDRPLGGGAPEIVHVNDAFCRMTGYSREEVVGRTPRILQGTGTDRERLDRIRRALDAGESVKTELLNYRKSGETFWVELDIFPVVPEAGAGTRPAYWISVQRDITERVRRSAAHLESERSLRAILAQYGSEMITILEPDGTPRYESPNVERTLGYAHREATGGDPLRFVHPEDAPKIIESVTESIATPGETGPVRFRMRHADGSWRHFESRSNNLCDDPDVRAIVVNTRDVTRHVQAEEALRKSEARRRAATGAAPLILFALDSEGVFTFAEGKGLELFPPRADGIIGRSVFELHPDHPRILENNVRALNGEVVEDTVEIDGLSFETRYSPLFDADGAVEGVIGVALDVTGRRSLERKLEHRAFHDYLTNLPNRARLMDHLSGLIEREAKTAAMLFLDLDDFKLVNDRYGHEAGDELLVAAAARLRECLGPDDLAARLGGDEFTVILEGAGASERAGRLAERILEAFQRPLRCRKAGGEISITPSIGVATICEDEQGSGRDLLRRADLAMYRAKANGKSRYETYRKGLGEAAAER
ncbi:bifunctional diguanylate cyclase/phosphodiesterase [Rubrobacter indicoceani]|uniref:sensor domain-containing protein n=1 Tax=Rubrobacter indicoceani TaxID=2051957 RepID=UPI0013C493AF|nr:PAS domain S-box protein [Rubrobacter indicoceani]